MRATNLRLGAHGRLESKRFPLIGPGDWKIDQTGEAEALGLEIYQTRRVATLDGWAIEQLGQIMRISSLQRDNPTGQRKLNSGKKTGFSCTILPVDEYNLGVQGSIEFFP